MLEAARQGQPITQEIYNGIKKAVTEKKALFVTLDEQIIFTNGTMHVPGYIMLFFSSGLKSITISLGLRELEAVMRISDFDDVYESSLTKKSIDTTCGSLRKRVEALEKKLV